MESMKGQGAANKRAPQRQAVAVLALDTRDEFFSHVRRAKSKEKIVFVTATHEPQIKPALHATPGAVYAVLTFNAGTAKAPALAFYVEEIEGVTELEWANDFPLKDGRTARQTVEAALAALSARIVEAGAVARRGRWELIEVV